MEKGKASDARFTPAAESTASGSATESDLRTQIAHLTEEREGLQTLPSEWADAANAARGLCESEANRWERASPSTSAHWRSVATRLGALYLTQDHLVVSKDIMALTAAHERLREAATTVRDTFAKDKAQGYHSRDRQFAIDILDFALTSPVGPPDDGPWDPDPACPRCHGTGETSNAQFTCACRWKRRPASTERPHQHDHEDEKDNLARVDTKAPSLDSRTAATDTKGSA